MKAEPEGDLSCGHAYVGKGKRVHMIWSFSPSLTLCGLGPYDRLTDEQVTCRNCVRVRVDGCLRKEARPEVTNF